MKFFVILISKLASYLSKLLKGSGSVISGSVALKLDKNILNKIKLPKDIIFVTGSSGKGSVVDLIYKILTGNNFKVTCNKEGSNVYNGIVSLIINNCSLSGKLKSDFLLVEVDERSLKYICKYIKPNYTLITNITRDQPPRNAHPHKIYEYIKNYLFENTTLILNSDDPLVNKMRINHSGKVITFGMDKTKFTSKNMLYNLDSQYCPNCHKKLEYKFYHYGHIGNYKCNNCDFQRGNPDFLAKDIDLNKKIITINNNKVHLSSDFIYSVYFTLGAYAISKTLSLTDEDILKVLNDESIKAKRLNIYNFYNRPWQMLISKNENNLSYRQSLEYIKKEKYDKTIILGFDSSSRRYKENDISWIWDIDFELLNDKYIKNIVLIGKFQYDLYVRLKYAKIDKNKIIIVDDISKLKNILKNKTKGKIFSMVCFDKEIQLKEIIKEANND